tara:strand:+ start:641 stop:808 length:168 start_codon:yes stop_codon:yes gene_type:complete
MNKRRFNIIAAFVCAFIIVWLVHIERNHEIFKACVSKGYSVKACRAAIDKHTALF